MRADHRPSSIPLSRRELLAVALVGVLLAAVFTWPIVARFDRAGRLDSGDALYSIWNVAWVAHALTTNPFQVYNANIFHPHMNTLAYSEANLVAGALAAPVWLLTGNPHATSNFVILLSFVLSGLTTYVLVKYLTGSRLSSAIAAISFSFCPFVFSHLAHVQLLMTFGLPLVLLSVHRFAEAPSIRTAIWLGLAMALQALASGYYGVFGGLVAGFGVLWFGMARGHWRRPAYWLWGAAAAGLALLIVAPFLAPYAQVQADGFARTLDDARLFSVRWRAYLASPNLVHRWMLDLIGTWSEVLFPGFIPIVFTVIALVLLGRRGADPAAGLRGHVVGFYLALAGLAYWTSTGPNGGLYSLMYQAMPFFTWLRAPARFGLLVTLSLVVIGSLGLASLTRQIRPSTRRLLIPGLIAFALARSTVGPLGLTDAPATPLAYRRLASLPEAPVAEFPFFVGGQERYRHTEYMLWSTLHWKPLLNGYSDHIPSDTHDEHQKLAVFPEPVAWDVLREHDARYVLVHWRFMSGDDIEFTRSRLTDLQRFIRPIVEASDVSLYEIVSWPPDPAETIRPPTPAS
jgi:hypothetical protein